MSQPVQESYNPAPIGVDGTFTNNAANVSLGGFNCVTAGTMTITSNAAAQVTNLPLAAGAFVPLPYMFANGVVVQLGGGASGLLAWV